MNILEERRKIVTQRINNVEFTCHQIEISILGSEIKQLKNYTTEPMNEFCNVNYYFKQLNKHAHLLFILTIGFISIYS